MDKPPLTLTKEQIEEIKKLRAKRARAEIFVASPAIERDVVETPEVSVQPEKAEGKLENIKLWSQISYEGTTYLVAEIKNELDENEYVLVPPDPAEKIETVSEVRLKTELESGKAVLVSEEENTSEKWTIKDAAEERWLRNMLAVLDEKSENKETIVESGKMTELFKKILEETREEIRLNLEKREQLKQKLEPIEKEYKLNELTEMIASASANLDSLIKELEKKKKNNLVKKFFDPKMSELTHKIARMNIELEQWEKRLKMQKEAVERILGKEKVKEREEMKEALRILEEQNSELEIKQKEVINALNPEKQI
jgi:hypothetical protein